MSAKTDPAKKRTITLKINNISTYMTKIGQRSKSPQQQVAGIGWHVLAFPSVIDNITYLSCFLEGVNTGKWTAWVYATFRIVKDDGGLGNEPSFHRKLMGNGPLLRADKGWADFVSSEELLFAANGLVANDTVEIRVDFSVAVARVASPNVLDIPGAPAADVKLKVGDSVFDANKGYLSEVSTVFRNVFARAEAAQGKTGTTVLKLKDLDASEFKEFLEVVRSTRYPITDTNVISLFRIADLFHVKRVVTDCEYHLFGDNRVPMFEKLKLAVDLNHARLKDHLISAMTCDDIKAINQNENKDQLGMGLLLALLDKHIRICHP